MPRIRSLKPEHKQHRKVGALSHFLYRMWVGMVTEADDAGRLVADPVWLRAVIFPYHPRETPVKLQAGLEALAGLGLCRLYAIEGVPYADFPSWGDHQRVDHPTPSKLPPYQGVNGSREPSRALANDTEGSDLDLIGSDLIGSDLNLSSTAEQFEAFWKPYPKKVGKDEARRAWQRASKAIAPEAILAALERQLGYLTRDQGKYIPNPATWLNQGRWQDEPPAPAVELNDTTSANVRAVQRAIERHRGGT